MTRVLVVCTGNICRSPLAEVLLRAQLDALGAGADVTVTSAGTRALVGHPMTRQAARQALEVGARTSDVARHTARQLDESLLAGADLVLAMTRAHRREIVQLRPQVLATTFTLREFARLAASVDPDTIPPASGDRLRPLLARIVAARGTTSGRQDPAGDDVADPYRRGDAAYQRATEQIAPAVAVAARLLSAARTR